MFIFNILQKIFCVFSCLASTDSAEFTAAAGYRYDTFDWSISGGSEGPNILSELEWDDLRMVNYYGQLRLRGGQAFYLRVTGNYGDIFHGKNIDSDYDGDNRTEIYAQSVNKAGRGEAFEISGALGLFQRRIGSCIVLAPVGGYALQEQHLHLFDGVQLFAPGYPDNTLLPNLNSTYRAKWCTGFVGVDVDAIISNSLRAFATAEYHFGPYRGIGHWNLREDILSDFKHNAYGTGWAMRLNLNYRLYHCVSCGLVGELITFQTGGGKDITKIEEVVFDNLMNPTGTELVTVTTPFNSAHWHSYRIMASIGIDF